MGLVFKLVIIFIGLLLSSKTIHMLYTLLLDYHLVLDFPLDYLLIISPSIGFFVMAVVTDCGFYRMKITSSAFTVLGVSLIRVGWLNIFLRNSDI